MSEAMQQPKNWRAVMVPTGIHKGKKLGELTPNQVRNFADYAKAGWFKEVAKRAAEEMGF